MQPMPASALTIITRKTPGSFGALMKPTAVINGYTVPLEWGPNVIPAQPGVHQIHISCQWMWKYGKADITVDNRTAPAAPVYYAVPWLTFMRGSIAHTPVKNPGLVGFLLFIGVPLVLVLLCCIGGALLDTTS